MLFRSHRNDTIEEIASLSHRFGLTVTFIKPDKELFLAIVQSLAQAAGIKLPVGELFARAEVFALANSGRSPRTARQFVDFLLAEQRS